MHITAKIWHFHTLHIHSHKSCFQTLFTSFRLVKRGFKSFGRVLWWWTSEEKLKTFHFSTPATTYWGKILFICASQYLFAFSRISFRNICSKKSAKELKKNRNNSKRIQRSGLLWIFCGDNSSFDWIIKFRRKKMCFFNFMLCNFSVRTLKCFKKEI